MLRDSIDKYVAENSNVERHRQLAATELGFDPQAWQQFAELGWLSVPFPEPLGGFGGGATDLMVVSEALGKGLLREPFLHTVASCGAVLAAASTEQQKTYIPAIIDGSAQWALAFAENGGGYDLARVATTATATGGGYILDGEKVSVLNGHCANYLLVTAAVEGALEGTGKNNEGLGIFIVDATSKGVSRKPFVAVDGSGGAHITLQEVALASDTLVGDPGAGLALLEGALDQAIIAIGGEALGAMQTLLAATVEYSQTREQFGQPIGTFQVLQHRMADMYLKVEETRSLLFNAAIALEEGREDIASACAALKVKVAEAGRFVAQQAVQLHGGIGMTDELNVGHHFKRLMLLEKLYGDERWHLQRYAVLTRTAAA